VRLRLKPRETLLIGMVGVAAVVALWPRFQDSESTPAVRKRSRAEAAALSPITRIDLVRLDAPASEVEVGRRDLFAYGPIVNRDDSPPPPEAAPPPPAVDMPPPSPLGPGAERAGGANARLPPMNLKFIGSVGNDEGVKVAVLVTERNEVLTGQSGEVVANRYRIERIGIESVDLEDVGTGQSRRIPLKGN
jgi:hypothetical protein